MEEFKIERKGYNKNEVENYISTLKANYESQLSEQQKNLQALKAENAELEQSLQEYVNKDSDISNALVVAVETAKEIENSAKTVYELEIQRVKLLYSKWHSVLRQIVLIYPEIRKNSNLGKLFKDFEGNIVGILEKENQMESLANEKGFIDDKMYAKNLLQRIRQESHPQETVVQNTQTPTIKIKRIDVDHTLEKAREKHNDNTKKKVKSEQVSMAVPEISEFEKFMNSEFDDFKSFKSGTNTKTKKNAYEENLVSHKEENGFDLKEALNPKEDLHDIMKIFNLEEE